MPVIDHMKVHLRVADRIFVDETARLFWSRGRKATKSGYFGPSVSDDRGHGGAGPPLVLFHYAPGRGREHPLRFWPDTAAGSCNATPTNPTMR